MSERILFEGVEFRQIPGWPGYAVSACGMAASEWINLGHGTYRRSGNWRVLSPGSDETGRLHVVLCGGGRKVNRRIHRLVAIAWIGPPPAGKPNVLHFDGNPGNNHVGNLRYGTTKENHDDSKRHGTASTPPAHWGSTNPLAKLTESDIPVIRQLIIEGKTKSSIAKQFGVSGCTIYRIGSGKLWGHIA